MARKPKFKPEITRVKLNPEQAVLACLCYDTGYMLIVGQEPPRRYTACHFPPGSKDPHLYRDLEPPSRETAIS